MTSTAKAMGRLPPLPTIKEILRLYNVFAMKSLSQNFLLDPKLLSKFVSMARPVKDKTVLEVGPGPGNITRCVLQQHAKYVIAIEKDKRFIPALKLLQEAANGRLLIAIGDILSIDMDKLFPPESKREWDEDSPPIHLIGNLPFNVSLPLTIKWLKCISERSSAWQFGRVPMTLTFQHEVAERMVAPPDNSQRCRLSLMCQNWCDVDYKFTIPNSAFLPKPQVDVGVVTLLPKVKPLVDIDFSIYEKFARTLFSTKRKHCKTALMPLFPINKRTELTQKLLSVADVDPSIHVTSLSDDEVVRLANTYSLILGQHPQLISYNYRGPQRDRDIQLC